MIVFSAIASAVAAALATTAAPVGASHAGRPAQLGGPQAYNLWKLRNVGVNNTPHLLVQHVASGQHADLVKSPLEKKYLALYFEQPFDHFDPNNTHTFKQRYWVDDRFYKEGGPVFVLDGGETSGVDRLPFLDHGILSILSNATGGLSIVLEHRYYGESVPVKDFTTDSLRWLTNEQAVEDSAEFMKHFNYSGIDRNLSALATPWIYYGGSYAGARAAHMRVLHPELAFGSIASSAVTHAAIDYSDYFEVIRLTNNQTCVGHIESAIKAIDQVLDVPLLSKPLKALFGLQDLEHDEDFVALLTEPLGGVQGTNWDPKESGDTWSRFCDIISSGGAGADIGWLRVPAEVVNYATWIRNEVVSLCPEGASVEECFGTYDDKKFQEPTVNSWRAWSFQVCTQWGYFMPAPADPSQPSLLSRRITLEYASKHCRQMFLPGKHFSVPVWPKVDQVNRLGDYGLEANRLAFIDGTNDPWIAATPHSWHAPKRPDTISRPFKLIPTGVHHWDENGLVDTSQEPKFIQRIHRAEVEFVKEWLKDADRKKRVVG